MKSFFSASAFVAALALAPSVFAADVYVTMKTYSDSACKYLSSTTTELSDEYTSLDACDNGYADDTCTANDDGNSEKNYCGSSITEYMTSAHFVKYNDTTCTTPIFAEAVYGYDGCVQTGEAEWSNADCDDEGYLTTYTCSDNSCDFCDGDASVETTCTEDNDDGTSFQAFCGSSSSDDVCFHGDDTLLLESGVAKPLSEVALGDKVQTADVNGALSFSKVVALPHATNNKRASFVNVVTDSGKSVKATKMHLLQQCDGSLAYAGSLVSGDCLRTVDGDEVVTAISMAMAEGIYTVVTTNEFLVVNGIVASPFAVSHGLANSYYNTHRIMAKVFPMALKSPLVFAANAFLTGLTGAFFTLAGSK